MWIPEALARDQGVGLGVEAADSRLADLRASIESVVWALYSVLPPDSPELNARAFALSAIVTPWAQQHTQDEVAARLEGRRQDLAPPFV